MAYVKAPSPVAIPRPVATEAELQRFLDTKDMSLLDKPMVFAMHDDYPGAMCCPQYFCCGCCCLAPCMFPLAFFSPEEITRYTYLELHRDRLVDKLGANVRCSGNVVQYEKVVPLDRVDDVRWIPADDCCCSDLTTIMVRSAGMQDGQYALRIRYLAQPMKVREVIDLAARLHMRENMQGIRGVPLQGMAPGQEVAMGRGGGDGVADRIQLLDGLVSRGALTPEEAASLRLPALAAPGPHPLARLADAAANREAGVLGPKEYDTLKAALIAQVVAAGGHAAVAAVAG